MEKITLTGWFADRGECSRLALRNKQRKTGTLKKIAGQYGRGLRNWLNGKGSKGRI